VKKKFNKIQAYVSFSLIFIFLIIGLIILYNFKEEILTCGDETLYDNCSLRKPYFCENGVLIEKASVCGCPEILTIKGDLCISEYQTNPKNISLKYILRGKENEIDFLVYEGMADYLSHLPRSIYYEKGETPLREDFKLRNINEKEQRELILPLVTKIQNIAENKEDQVRIAISIVQKIPFDKSEKTINFLNNELDYSRYPYEVLYDNKGICGEKSELLAFLLKEIGYGVVLFYHSLENHESVGIKCPVDYGLNNVGYCFIETTGPSIITNNQNEYIGTEKLSSKPEVILISEGNSLGNNLYEYKDAQKLIEINEVIKEKGRINMIDYYRLKNIKKKYGLDSY
jgi:hypothetical protein